MNGIRREADDALLRELGLARSATWRLMEYVEEGTDPEYYLEFPALDAYPEFRAIFTTRLGGRSQGPYAGLNLGLTNQDEPENIRENYAIAARLMDCAIEDLVLSQQTHTDNVRVVTEEDRGKAVVRERDYTDVDALVSNTPGLTLTTLHADCTPLIFADPEHRAVGLAHAGWRGTIKGVGPAALRAMTETYGTDPGKVIVIIGPTIRAANYEVGPEVAEQFTRRFGAGVCRDDGILVPGQGDRSYLDLPLANRRMLMRMGVPEDHIFDTGLDTATNPALFYSHRAAKGGPRGNMGALIRIL